MLKIFKVGWILIGSCFSGGKNSSESIVIIIADVWTIIKMI